MSYNIDSSDTDDGSLDLQGSASDIDVSQVFILPSLTSFFVKLDVSKYEQYKPK